MTEKASLETVEPGRAAEPSGLVGARPRGEFDVLVLDAATKMSLASVRSLGRAGLRVALGECFAESDRSRPVAAFRSRYSSCNVVLPSYADEPLAFASAVVNFIREHPTQVVLPVVDGSIAALQPQRARLAELGSVLAVPPDDVLAVANDKERTLKVARSLGIAYPKTMRIDSVDDVASVVAELGLPLVLKPTVSWSTQASARLAPLEVIDQSEAVRVTSEFLLRGSTVLAQQWASGRREGVTLFVADGQVVARCAHVAHRTVPPLGGVSVMRESLPASTELYAAAASLVKAIKLEGPCEVEFRRDAVGRPLLMEINARLAGTIENAVRSGVDFPLMIWEWTTGQPVNPVMEYKAGVRTRWLAGDVRWLRDTFSRAGRPDTVSRSRALWWFGSEFFRTRHYDFVDWHDMRPAMAELGSAAVAARQWWRSRAHSRI